MNIQRERRCSNRLSATPCVLIGVSDKKTNLISFSYETFLEVVIEHLWAS